MIPTLSENPTGLHQRYVVSKANGEPVDPEAIYFVLRLDKHGRDPFHTAACRAAANTYAGHVQSKVCGAPHLAPIGRELADLLAEIDPPDLTVDKVGGSLLVCVDPKRGEVVINLDFDRVGHLTFSPKQARGLALLLREKADEVERAAGSA